MELRFEMNFNRLIKVYSSLMTPIFTRALLKGVAAGTEHQRLLQSLICNYVVDIGANRGQFALAARQNFPQAKIVSFEPLKEPAALFRRVFASDPQVILYECAIGPRAEETAIHISQADDSSSLLPIAPLQDKLFPGTAEKETRLVQIKPLDAVLGEKEITSPAFLKMDVQGFEIAALEGCKSLLPWFAYLYIECSFVELYAGQALAHNVISYLNQLGFALTGVYNLSYDKKGLAIQGDFLFNNTNPRDK
jgi:FkbM family methyltransferase